MSLRPVFTSFAGLAAMAVLAACSAQAKQEAAPPPAQVTVTPVAFKELRQWDDFTGRLEAVDTVDVRPRVSGYIDGARFEEGARVRKGQVLFQIDPRPYQAALDRHYNDGPPDDWEQTFVSSYATMHAAEDWAETFAHYMHIRDTLDTAAAFGFAPAAATFERKVLGPSGFDAIIELWLPLSWALNMMNRSMGKADLYPFVLPPAVLDKMRFIHTVIEEITSDPAKLAEVSGP